jgi:hypothetical protein
MAATAGAAKMPAPDETWPDSIPLFAAGLAACIAGLLCWRVGLRREDVAAQDTSLGPKALLRLIIDCRRAVAQVRNDFSKLDPDVVRDRIDSLLNTYFEPVVENRSRLIEHYGMRRGADLLLQFAFVERYINRVWSATADACPAEARAALDTAATAIDELSKAAEIELNQSP